MKQGILLDLAGVLYDGNTAIPGSVSAVNRLRQAGLPIRFLTNSTRLPRRKLLQRLDNIGFSIEDHELFTPARAAIALLAARNKSPHLLIHPDLAEDFTGAALHKPERCVVVGDAAQHFTYDAMNAAFRALDKGADLIALAANRTFRDSDGKISIDAGAFVAALEYASGKTAEILGKPALAFFESALDSMGCQAADAVMVGDDAEADVAGALTAGLGQAVLVRTGKYRPGDAEKADPSPTHVADDLAAAVDWILLA